MTTDNFGYGQQGPSDATSEFNKISFLVNRVLARVRTCAVVKVMAVHAEGEVAEVGFLDAMVMTNQLDGVGNSVPHATIFNLPFFRLQGGSNAVVIDPQAGDLGLALICDRDISSVKEARGQANPGSRRRFDLADGVYVGGILNGAPDQYVLFTARGVKIADKNGNVIESTATGMTLTDKNANQIQMKVGVVNIVTGVFQVNGTPVTIP